jgi:hypothetical protein
MDGAASAPLRYAVQGFAALRRRESKWAGEKEPQELSLGGWVVGNRSMRMHSGGRMPPPESSR